MDTRLNDWFMTEVRQKLDVELDDATIATACAIANTMTQTFVMNARVSGFENDEELNLTALFVIASFIGSLSCKIGAQTPLDVACRTALTDFENHSVKIRAVLQILLEADVLDRQALN